MITDFVYDGLNPVKATVGATTVDMLTGLGIDGSLTRTSGGTPEYFLGEALGSTVGLVDGTGAVATEYSYEPFGASTASGTSSSNELGYTGREDDGTGVYYYRARYYHPGLQRFISEDPIGIAGGDPNLYAYVFNSPVLLNDPLGLEPVTITTGAAIAIVCAVGAVAGDAVVLAVNGRKSTLTQLAAGAALGCTGGVAVLGAWAAGAAAWGAATGAEAAGGLSSGAMGQIIGWGTGQTLKAVAQTHAVTAGLTAAAVARMVQQGLTREWIVAQLAKYQSSIVEGGKKLQNTQLLARKELMEKVLQLWPK
jgi:RHS repeat-associated protein